MFVPQLSGRFAEECQRIKWSSTVFTGEIGWKRVVKLARDWK